MKPTRRLTRGGGGFVTMDVVMALLIIGTLITALVISTARQRKATDQLAAQRAATRQVEESLALLYTGQHPTSNVLVEDLPDPAPPGTRWVRVSATEHGTTASLVGLAGGQP